MDYISKHCGDRAVLMYYMQLHPEFTRAAVDLALASNMKIIRMLDQKAVYVSEEGYYIGTLTHSTYRGDMIYKYKSPFVGKEKASARSGKDTRDAVKITGIISTLKKNTEVPDKNRLLRFVMNGMVAARRVVNASARRPVFEIGSEDSWQLLKYFVTNDNFELQVKKERLETKYEEFCEKLSKAAEIAKDLSRFDNCRVVSVNLDDSGIYYLVGEATFDKETNITITEELKRYGSLKDSPVAVDAAMLRTYAEGKTWFDRSNDLGIPKMDKFLEDVDVCVGYLNSYCHWVLFPKHGA
jgi:hypothetical protein